MSFATNAHGHGLAAAICCVLPTVHLYAHRPGPLAMLTRAYIYIYIYNFVFVFQSAIYLFLCHMNFRVLYFWVVLNLKYTKCLLDVCNVPYLHNVYFVVMFIVFNYSCVFWPNLFSIVLHWIFEYVSMFFEIRYVSFLPFCKKYSVINVHNTYNISFLYTPDKQCFSTTTPFLLHCQLCMFYVGQFGGGQRSSTYKITSIRSRVDCSTTCGWGNLTWQWKFFHMKFVNEHGGVHLQIANFH